MPADRQPAEEPRRYGPLARGWHALLIGGLVALGVTMPNVIFGVSPLVTGNSGPTAENLGTHHEPSVDVVAFEEDEHERIVRLELYKWCGFCHTKKVGEEHLLGPNLYGIFGQRAGTVPNYANYSDAMVEARSGGLVWDDETISAYIHDTQAFMPGTNMIISIGDIPSKKDRDRIINILKKETMGERVTIRPRSDEENGDGYD